MDISIPMMMVSTRTITCFMRAEILAFAISLKSNLSILGIFLLIEYIVNIVGADDPFFPKPGKNLHWCLKVGLWNLKPGLK
jgi:hypothetical protein